MNKLLVTSIFVALSAAVLAAPSSRNRRGAKVADGADTEEASAKGARVAISQPPRLGAQTCLNAPGIAGQSLIGQCYKKQRRWIVLETKYDTSPTAESKFTDQLNFTWHVLLETKSATENKGNKEKLSPYSYFTTSVTYFNIPAGSHASSVVLPPSYLERYGEPKAVGVVITNQNGDEIAGDSWSEVKGIKPSMKFWDDSKIMDARMGEKPMIERRQGLVDRSKTIWALVNPNDYEATIQ
jgi:hypothetical protein